MKPALAMFVLLLLTSATLAGTPPSTPTSTAMATPAPTTAPTSAPTPAPHPHKHHKHHKPKPLNTTLQPRWYLDRVPLVDRKGV